MQLTQLIGHPSPKYVPTPIRHSPKHTSHCGSPIIDLSTADTYDSEKSLQKVSSESPGNKKKPKKHHDQQSKNQKVTTCGNKRGLVRPQLSLT